MSYVAYGISIDSFLPLPGFFSATESADVVVRIGTVGHTGTTHRLDNGESAKTRKVAIYRTRWATFLVREGREVIVDPVPGAEEGFLRLFILGPIMGIILHQRGYFTLHASTVAIDGVAVTFLGQKGEGKSTLAAALHKLGHRVVSDDITAIQLGEAGATVFPGFPELKLLPEAVASLGNAPDQFQQFHSRSEKRAYPVTHEFSHASLPLMRVYVLDEGPRCRIQRLSPRDALREIAHHAYTTQLERRTRLLAAKDEASLHFNRCVSLVERVPICRLRRPRILRELPDVVRLIEIDITDATVL